MTTEEAKTLLYNIFNIEFIKHVDAVYHSTNLILHYYDKKSIIEIYTRNSKNYNNIIDLLNKKQNHGFIIFENKYNCFIRFILYNNLQNIDI